MPKSNHGPGAQIITSQQINMLIKQFQTVNYGQLTSVKENTKKIFLELVWSGKKSVYCNNQKIIKLVSF